MTLLQKTVSVHCILQHEVEVLVTDLANEQHNISAKVIN